MTTLENDALMTAARVASQILEKFEARKRIDQGYTRIDAEQIASYSDVVVMYRKFDVLLGGFLVEDGTPGIVINWDRPRGLVHMTCAHELGHFALGHESSSDTTIDVARNAALVERAANQFAYALLAPSWLVAQTMRSQRWGRNTLRSPHVVYQMSLRLGMSYKAMVWSLVRLGYMATNDALEIIDVQPIALKRELLGGSSPVNSKSDVWLLSAADRDRVLEPSLADQIVFDLPNHASSGHIWSLDEVQSEGFMLKPFVRDARLAPIRRDAEILVGGHGPTLRYELSPVEMASPTEYIEDDSPVKVGEGATTTSGSNTRKRKISIRECAPWFAKGNTVDQLSLFAEFERIEDGLPRSVLDQRIARTRLA